MKTNSFIWWLIISIITLIIEIPKNVKISFLINILIWLDILLFIIISYIFFSISSIRNKQKLESFIDFGDFIGKYFLSIFGIFSAYLLFVTDSLNKLGSPIIFGLLWYFLLYVFILIVAIFPTAKMFLQNIKSPIPQIYTFLIIFIFGWSFSVLTALISVTQLRLPILLDVYYFTFISYFELIVLLCYTLYFFEIKLKPFTN